MSRVRYILRFCAERRGDATLIGGPPSRAASGHVVYDAAVADFSAETCAGWSTDPLLHFCSFMSARRP